LLRNITVTSLWKCNELIVTQQELLRYYSNTAKGLTCHNILKGETEELGEKPVPMPLFPPQTPHIY
jgi:hypothetical protein